MTDQREQLTRAARQLIEIEELFGGLMPAIPAERYPLPKIERTVPPPPTLSAKERSDALNGIAETVATCKLCPLAAGRTNTVPGEGSAQAKLVFVGEAPGHDEDVSGRPFVGRAGQLLERMIAAMGLSRDDVFICNMLKCRPPNNRPPTPEEITACWDYLIEQLQTLRPKVIVTLGNPATQNLLSTRVGITKLRGQWQSLPDIGPGLEGIAVMPTFHPSYVLRQYNAETRGKVWSDLQKVMAQLGLKMPDKDKAT